MATRARGMNAKRKKSGRDRKTAREISAAFPPLDLHEIPRLFHGKSAFMTGVTGMLGKVLLEKMIRSTPDIRVIYCLIRARQGQSAQSRMEEELFGSRIWDRLLHTPKSDGGFAGDKCALRAHLQSKIVAVEGDLLSGMEEFTERVISGVKTSCKQPPPEGVLGISQEWRARLRSEGVDIVVHNAATVNFDEPIDLSVRMNTLAPLAMMHLAREWRAMAHVHVSTAYVIAHHPSGHRSPERLDTSPRGLDPDEVIRTVIEFGKRNRRRKNSQQLLERIAINAMGTFPNTYTLTKHMAEMKITELNRELGLPLTIVRPSIIGASLREPSPGWIDTLSAAAAVFTAGGLGMLRILPGNPQGIGDIVPVDMVVNLMLLRMADLLNYRLRWVEKDGNSSTCPPVPPLVFAHSATSTMNPVKWRTCETIGETFYFDNSLHQAGPVIGYDMINNPHRFNVEWWLRFTMPLYLYRTAAQAVDSTHHMEEAAKLGKSVEQGIRISNLFKAFTKNEFFYETDQVERYVKDAKMQMALLSGSSFSPSVETEGYRPAENPFNVDSREIIWNTYLRSFSYGIRRFILQEDMVPLPPQLVSHKNNVQLTTDNLIAWDHDHHPISFPGLFPDATWAYTSGRAPGYTSRGVFGKLLGWTGWQESKLHEAEHISRRISRTRLEMKALVLASDTVRQAAARVDNYRKYRNAQGDERNKSKSSRSIEGIGLGSASGIAGAEEIFMEMAADMNIKKARPASYFLRKAWRHLYDSINVDEDGLERVRRLLQGKSPNLPGSSYLHDGSIERQVVSAVGNRKRHSMKAAVASESKTDRRSHCVVLVPSHRSYVDFVILSYIFFAYNMPIPFIAAGDWIKKLGPMTQAMRHAGAFVIKRSFRPIPRDNEREGNIAPEADSAVEAGENLYSAVYSSYIQQLVSDGQSLEFFLEGTRSRSGKSLPPKTGMLRSIIEPWLKGHAPDLARIGSAGSSSQASGKADDEGHSMYTGDIHFVPVTIDYERTLELSAMASEMLGREKTPESLRNLFQWVAHSVADSLGQSASAFLSAIGLPAREVKTRMAGGSDFSSGRSRPLKGGKQGLPDLNESGYFAKGYGPPLKMTTLGSVSLQFGEPISLANYAQNHMSQTASNRLGLGVGSSLLPSISPSLDLKIGSLTSDLAYHVIDCLHSRSVAHGTHIVAAVLLMYRSAGSINFKDLESHVRLLANEIEARGMIVDLAPRHPSQWSTAIRRALGLLKDSISEVRTGVFAPNGESVYTSSRRERRGRDGGSIDPRIHYIELAHLRNKIMHIFSNEALWTCALHACSKKHAAMRQVSVGGVPLHELLNHVVFMDKLFAREFVRNRKYELPDDYQLSVYREMLESTSGDRTQIFEVSKGVSSGGASDHGEIVSIAPNKGETMYAFLCSLLWPFLDGYYAAAITLFSLVPTVRFAREDLIVKMQWVAEALYHDRKIQHYESCSLDTLRNALAAFEDLGILGAAEDARGPSKLVQLMPKYREHTLLQEFVAKIGRLRKASDPLMSGSDAATLSATTMAELPMIQKSRL